MYRILDIAVGRKRNRNRIQSVVIYIVYHSRSVTLFNVLDIESATAVLERPGTTLLVAKLLVHHLFSQAGRRHSISIGRNRQRGRPSPHFSSIDSNPSACSLPTLVRIPMVGFIMRCNDCISPGIDIPPRICQGLYHRSSPTPRAEHLSGC